MFLVSQITTVMTASLQYFFPVKFGTFTNRVKE